MEHSTQVRIVPGSDTAVLLVHGVLGTPHQFDPLLPAIPEKWSMVNLLLHGHGGRVEDFSKARMKDWEIQVAAEVAKLAKTHRKVWIVGHSMGTLLAVDAALNHPEQVQGLFLISPPLLLAPKPALVNRVLMVGLNIGEKDDPKLEPLWRAYSLQPEHRFWKFFGWVPAYIGLLQKIVYTRKKMPELQVPTMVIHCALDDLVSHRTEMLFSRCPTVRMTRLENSTHYAYTKEDVHRLKDVFRTFTGYKKSL